MILKCVSTDHQWWPSWNITVVRMKLEWSLIVAYQSLYQNLHKVTIFGVWLGNIPISWEKHVGNCKVFQPLHSFKIFFPISVLIAPALEPLIAAFLHFSHEDIDGRNKVSITDMMLCKEHEANHHKPQASHLNFVARQIAPRRSDCFRFSSLVKL